MKRILLTLSAALLAGALSAQTSGPRQGPGPHAYGDKDKDGYCDHCGRKTGQGQGQGQGRANRGKGHHHHGHDGPCCGKEAPAQQPKK